MMDVLASLCHPSYLPIACVEMHTTGEPVRIIYRGYPDISGTLLEQRTKAKQHHDDICQRLMLEPRGHSEMYGAILRPKTELVNSGQAHIGVLFCHNEGYSTMCGHATIALGRFLVDTHDPMIFPARNTLHFDNVSQTITILLHAPCGVVEVCVPASEDVLGISQSDLSRAVSFLSVPSFVTALDLKVEIPTSHCWPELGDRAVVTVSTVYGGAFYALISARELGFPSGLQSSSGSLEVDAMSRATALLKTTIMDNAELRKKVAHPEFEELSFLYSIMVVDEKLGIPHPGTKGAETGLCFFADQQIDRSPTGSCVAARVAVATTKGLLKLGERWTYHSIVSNTHAGEGAFVGQPERFVDVQGQGRGVLVWTYGQGWYVGFSTFVVENSDKIGKVGFNIKSILAGGRV